MKILRDYVIKEFIGPFFLALLVLTFVLLLGNLVKIADLVIRKGVDFTSVFKLLAFMMPALFRYTLPISSLVAVLLSLGRLSSDNEIIAIRSSGINILRLISPLFFIGIILSLFLVILNDRVIPYAHFASRKTLIEVGVKNPTATLEPGIFIDSFEKYILFIYHVDPKRNKLKNIRIYELQGEDKPTRTIVAKSGEFISIPEKKIVKLKLMDGTSDEPDPENPQNFYKLNFKTYFMSLNLADAQEGGEIGKKPKDMTIRELQNEIAKLKKEGVNVLPLITELTEKIALSFSCFIFMLIGIPMAVITHRREKSINFSIAFVIVGIYYILLMIFEALSHEGHLPPEVAIWIPNIILGSVGGILTYRICAS